MFLFFSDLKIFLSFLFCSFPKLRSTAKAMVRRVLAGLSWLPHVRASRSGFLLLVFTSRVNSLPPWKFLLVASSSLLFLAAQDDGTRMSERLSQLESLRGEVLYLQSHHHSWIDDRHWHHWSQIFKVWGSATNCQVQKESQVHERVKSPSTKISLKNIKAKIWQLEKMEWWYSNQLNNPQPPQQQDGKLRSRKVMR